MIYPKLLSLLDLYTRCQVTKYTKYTRLLTLQSVADARFSDEVYGAGGVRFYLTAQVANIDMEQVILILETSSPDLLQQVMVRYYPAGVCHQCFEYAIFVRSELNFFAVYCY